jgi:hypothetical protein
MPPPDAASSNPLLQLSVHSLPSAGAASPQRTRMGRLKMLLIWAVCAAPVVASYLSYYVVKPQGRINHGTLITPPKPMAAEPGLAFTDLQGQAVAPQALQGQWLLVSVAGGACDAACERQLYLQRQLREVLGPRQGPRGPRLADPRPGRGATGLVAGAGPGPGRCGSTLRGCRSGCKPTRGRPSAVTCIWSTPGGTG